VLQYTPVVIVSNTNLELLENLRKSLQSGSVKKAVRQIGRKQAYAFRIRGRAPVYSLLQKTMCYLIQKRAVGQAVMRYIETRDPAIVTEIRALNRRVREESYSASYAIFSDSANITSTDT
jgi:hypothetical protein